MTGEEAVKALTLLCRHCGFDEMGCSEAVVNATGVEKSSSANFPQSSDLNNFTFYMHTIELSRARSIDLAVCF